MDIIDNYKKLALENDIDSMLSLGKIYLFGGGVPVNYKQAKYWYEKAANLGNADAMNSLGYIYNYGFGISIDYKLAIYWYEKAIELENTLAMNNLAYLFYSGKGVTLDYKKARYWYEKAANRGNVKAMNNLASFYYCGIGIEANCKKALFWYEKAANLGFTIAMYNLGNIYETNETIKDYKKALFWYEKAIKLGNYDSIERLEALRKKINKGTIYNRDNNEMDKNKIYKLNKIISECKSKFVNRDDTIKILANNIFHSNLVINKLKDNKTIRNNISTILLVASTGSGKTSIISDIVSKFDIPYIHISLGCYTQTGYKGLDLQDIFLSLIKASNGDTKKAMEGIVVLDEFDKLRIDSEGVVLGFNKGLQQELLSYLEGRKVFLKSESGSIIEFDTSKITFILAGAFQDITESYKYEEVEKQVLNGYLPELISRINIIHIMPKYTKQDYIDILTNSEISPLKEFTLVCGMYNKSLIISPYAPFIDSIAEEAVFLDQGMRGLNNIFANIRSLLLDDLINGQEDISLLSSYEDLKRIKQRKRRL